MTANVCTGPDGRPAAGPDPVREVVTRIADPRYPRWRRQVAATGFCRHPIRLQGHCDAIDSGTGELRASYDTASEPSGTLLIACGNRRATICPPCSATYRADTWQLIAAGLRGGKGIPDTITDHPMIFVTLTAPSFGPVHTIRTPHGGRRTNLCRRARGLCTHGRPRGCTIRHADGDRALGTPICPECFDYTGAVLWNATVGELWRRTTIYLRRALAYQSEMTPAACGKQVRLAFTKVAEYQRRGQIHLHAVLRLDAAPPKHDPEQIAPPPAPFDADLLAAATREAVASVTAPIPAVDGTERVARWGTQLDLREIVGGSENVNPEAIAAYIAKYATKSSDAGGPGLDRPIRRRSDLELLQTTDHARRLVTRAWTLGRRPELADLRLRKWAHTCGYRGHFSTRSRRYATTLSALRRARADWKQAHTRHPGPDPWHILDDNDHIVRLSQFTYTGNGHHTAGDTWLANTDEQKHALGKQELRERPAAPPPTAQEQP